MTDLEEDAGSKEGEHDDPIETQWGSCEDAEAKGVHARGYIACRFQICCL